MDRFTLICQLLWIYVDYASSFGKNVTLVATSTDVVAGTSVTLTCTAFGIDEITWHGPSGQITYLSGCNQLSEFNGPDVARFGITCSFGIGSQFGTLSNLTITSFDPGRDQGSWGCKDANEQVAEGYISLTSQEVGIKDIHISSTPGSITATNQLTLLEQESDTLTCTAECNGTCQYKWMKGTELVASTSHLTLKNITSTASGQYICHASYDGVELTKSVLISVLPRDYVTFDPPSDLITVSEGQTVSINCSAQNGMCDQNEYRRCVNCWDNHSNTAGTCEQLVIPNATLSMAGLYRCHYTEEEPGINALWSTFKTLEVRVMAGPSSIVIYPNVDIVTIISGSAVTLNCSADCQLECNYSWKSVSNPTVIISSAATLTMSNVSRSQQGEYMCTASNVGGNVTRIIYVEAWENEFDELANSSLVTSNHNPTPGSSVTLTCSVQRSTTDGSPEQVDWYGPHGLVAAFMMCYRLNDIDGPNVTDYTIDCIDGSTTGDGWTISTLTINNYIPERDAGNWSCLDDTRGPSLKVISPDKPSSAVITPSSDPVTVTSGESLSFNCSADCQPDCSYTWKYNNVLVSNIDTYIISTIGTNQSGIYTCTATNALGSVTASTNVQVNYGPSSVIITPTSDPVTITNGESLNFVCSVDCQPVCSYTWKYNNVIVSTTATFNIISITNSQNGVYTCTATNVLGNTTKSTSVAVNYGPSSVMITPTEDPVNVQYGENVSFVCSSVCKPICNYRWKYNNVVVSTNATYFTTITQNGTYSCTAANDIGSVTESSNIVVKSYVKTVVVQSDSTPSTMEPGSSITMTCEADCMPVNSCSYVWKDKHNRILSVTREVTLTNVTTSDAGKYTCMASNDMSKSSSIQVALKYAPDAANMVIHRAPNLSSYDKGSSLTLDCSVSCVPDCTIQWSKGTTVFTTSNGVLSLSALETDDAGTYTCTAGNSMAGPIEKTTTISVKVTIFGAGSGSSSLFAWMITFLKIVGCLLPALIMC